MARYRKAEDKRDDFYLSALSFAQSLYLEGKPAQALLQINKSFFAHHPSEEMLTMWPPAYRAVCWIISREQARGENELFLGNPVRHYQHLASRISGPQARARRWRAWACFHLAKKVAPGFPRDERQIAQERLTIPSFPHTLGRLETLGWRGEGNVLHGTWKDLVTPGK
ncbi:hypothetical protein [Roseibacillus ishigakijimensis]|uniref:hypothetical protein n=1 Tax=Roseibacillus ishigakijimensis TaxID=454146 RepID=UPI0036338ACD